MIDGNRAVGVTANPAVVVSVNRDAGHHFSKPSRADIRLVAGLGIEGDAHFGETVQHLSRKKRDPGAPNLRQVHLIHRELFDEMAADGFVVEPGDMGENVTTQGVDLLGLPRGSRLAIGDDAVVEITGLRNPCQQINAFQQGLMKQMVGTDADGRVVRRSGVMAIVVEGGLVRPGDVITVRLPAGVPEPLGVV